jgi:hypothetical protein
LDLGLAPFTRLDRWNKCGLLINRTSKGLGHSAQNWRERIAGEARWALWWQLVVWQGLGGQSSGDPTITKRQKIQIFAGVKIKIFSDLLKRVFEGFCNFSKK